MPHQEIYQVWNPQQKMWVKMKNGQILENSSFKFEDLPVFGKHRSGGEDDSTTEDDSSSMEVDKESPPDDQGESGPDDQEDYFPFF